jgi:DNA polymerase III alpha subunit
MINLRVRTEYTFSGAYGPLPKVLAAVRDAPSVGIADRHGTWGHVAFSKACKKAGKQPIFGVELGVVSVLERERHPSNWMAFLARTDAGLQELYELVTESTTDDHFYYHPRIDYKRLSAVTDNLIILSGTNPIWDRLPKRQKNLYVELAPSSQPAAVEWARANRRPLVATSDNYYPAFENRAVYEIIAGRNRDSRTTPMHILDRWEWLNYWPGQTAALDMTRALAAECRAVIPQAKMVKYHSKQTLEQMCRAAAPARGINLKDPVYKARLRRELDLITEKDFDDYFFVIADMLRYAKQHMLVGPARGSSCGSLVCYLLSITEIDPIPFSLIFERFIDINRKDLPDIDIDFPDDRREMVFEYIRQKYGVDCVARLGTIMRYKAKSAIDVVAISLKIPIGEVENLKGAIIERSGGDARAAFCILDTFNELEVGKTMLAKYPHLRVAADIEMHARGTGQHAAGIVITAEPISKFCSRNMQTGAIMVDKYDAEAVNLLKIDALGLRTLSVIQDCLDQIGQSREWLMKRPLGDEDAFDVINNSRFAGIFQFEGYALQSLCQQMKIEDFEDIASLGALARPGPLNSGGANEFVKRRTGQVPVTYLHPLCKEMTKVTYGVVIYQEQVMQIGRVVGQLSWEDVSELRKAMAKSKGQEFFDQYWNKFRAGALAQGVTEEDANQIWKNINTMGSWSFNRSHAVSYGMVTYWCMVLKAHYPLEWATACLRHASGADQCVKLLRELDSEGYKYKDFNIQRSEINWSVKDGLLIGGLLNVDGVGPSKAEGIMERRRAGRPLTPAMQKKLEAAVTPFSYEKVFECRVRFGDLLKNPSRYNISSKIWRLSDITSEMEGEFVFLGKMVKKDLRDLNEPLFLQKRGGRYETGQTLFLNMTVEDDTASILLSVNKRDYLDIGKPLVETGRIGEWYLWKGWMRRGFRKVYVKRCWPESRFNTPVE